MSIRNELFFLLLKRQSAFKANRNAILTVMNVYIMCSCMHMHTVLASTLQGVSRAHGSSEYVAPEATSASKLRSRTFDHLQIAGQWLCHLHPVHTQTLEYQPNKGRQCTLHRPAQPVMCVAPSACRQILEIILLSVRCCYS